MTIGFLGAIIGACLALLGGFIRDKDESQSLLDFFATIILYLGGSLLVLGAIAMFAGIVFHWIGMFKPR